jgi:hypothetical protein
MIRYKPHIKLNSAKQSEKAISMKFVYGFADKENEKSQPEPDYTKMACVSPIACPIQFGSYPELYILF